MNINTSYPLRRIGNGDHRIVMLHGWFSFGGSWDPLLPHLDSNAFEFVFPEYRGYGARRGVPGAFTIEEAADDVIELTDSLGWDRFSLVGHSMGGTVMQQVLVKAPARTRALIGISPVPACGVPFDDETWQVFTNAVTEPALRRAIIDRSTGGALSGTYLDAMTKRSSAESDEDAFGRYLRSWARTDYHEQIAGSDIPVKVIVGETDPDVNAAFMAATFGQWYPNSEIRVLPNAGHYAMDEAPVALATEIEKFLLLH